MPAMSDMVSALMRVADNWPMAVAVSPVKVPMVGLSQLFNCLYMGHFLPEPSVLPWRLKP